MSDDFNLEDTLKNIFFAGVGAVSLSAEKSKKVIDKLVEKVARLVSQATDLPAISAASRQGSAAVERFELLQAGKGSFVLGVPQATAAETQALTEEFDKLTALLLKLGLTRRELMDRIEKGGNDHA